MDITRIPLDLIDDSMVPRDRTALDDTALDELYLAILRDGLRQPIEVMDFGEDREGRTHGLLSGLRRLTAFRRLAEHFAGDARYATIPAVVHPPMQDGTQAMRLMVEENAIRDGISPWDQARVAVDAVPSYFPTTDAAVNELYRTLDRQRRARIRSVCTVVEALSHVLNQPDSLTQRQLLRLSAACREGFTDLIETALQQSKSRTPAAQWRLVENILSEAETEARSPEPPDPRPGRPRRFCRPRDGLGVRREKLPEGWCLRFSGREATGMLMEEIMDEVERLVGVRG